MSDPILSIFEMATHCLGKYSLKLPQNRHILKSRIELRNLLIIVSNHQSIIGWYIGYTWAHISQAMHLSNLKWIHPRKCFDEINFS